jgi:hypothetical protein
MINNREPQISNWKAVTSNNWKRKMFALHRSFFSLDIIYSRRPIKSKTPETIGTIMRNMSVQLSAVSFQKKLRGGTDSDERCPTLLPIVLF